MNFKGFVFMLALLACSLRRISSLAVPMTVVKNAAGLGAFCLDGSPPAYHLDRGSGEGSDNWILTFEGGGWCNNVATCADRAKSRRGSTNLMVKYEPFNGILSNDADLNPDFYNWNRVKLRYCDGASFLGDAELNTGGTVLQFRGQKIWDAIIKDLLPKGLGRARKALLAGCSAGGLATFFHCDSFAKYLPNAATVKCLSDAGFFLDEKDISQSYHMRLFFKGVVSLQGVEKNLDKRCTSSAQFPYLCFFPQYLLPHIATPFFVLNSAYDIYQFRHILAPPTADRSGQWAKCTSDPTVCDASQIDVLQGFRNDMLRALKPLRDSKSGGTYINSCFAHCQSEIQETWLRDDSPKIQDKTIARAVGDWYFERAITKVIDCPYPCDKTCHNLLI